MKSLSSLVFSTIFLFSSASYADTPLRYCRPNNMVSAHAYIADSQKFFTEEGLTVDFQTATNAKICQDLMIAGSSDLSTGADGPFTYLSAHPHTLGLIAVNGKNPEIALFARKDRGIEKAEDLRGKTVGYLPGTVSYLYLVRLLEKHGLTMKDLKLIALQPPAMGQALVGGIIDAFVIWEPWGANALKQIPDKGIRISDPSVYQFRPLVLASQEFRTKYPEKAKGVLRALLKSEEFLTTHKKESIEILSKAISLEPNVLEDLWSQYDFRVSFDQAEIDSLFVDNFSWIQKNDKELGSASVPHFRSFFDASFLQAVDASRVR